MIRPHFWIYFFYALLGRMGANLVATRTLSRRNFSRDCDRIAEQLLTTMFVRNYVLQPGWLCEQEREVKEYVPLNAGVRQGCVFSPRVFTGVLEWVMRQWCCIAESNGLSIALHGGLRPLLGLQFPDDIFIFHCNVRDCLHLPDDMVNALDEFV